MRMKDPDPKKWDPPFSMSSINNEEFLSCTGKNIADGIESLLGAVFLSNNLHKTLQFISDIGLVPMEQANLMRYFPDQDLTFKLGEDLDDYNFTLHDTIQEIFQKYYSIDPIPQEQKDRLSKIIDSSRPVNGICHAFE